MLDSFPSYTHLASPMTSMFKKLQKFLSITDYAITCPFDIRSLPYFSLLKAKTLWQTWARWCWFDKASKDDKDAGTRLGTLRWLPYEIRQQIFQIVLEDYFGEVDEQVERQLYKFNRGRFPLHGHVNRSMLQIHFEKQHCFCKRDRIPNVFDLRSYFGFRQATERLPMSLRLASPSIQTEFDCLFLSRSTFHFTCPSTLHKFLDQLSPFEQRQLKCLNLFMFPYFVCDSDSLTCRDQWMAVCQRLPPGLKSVELQPPYRLRDVPGFWRNKSIYLYSGQANDYVNRLAKESLEELFKKVSRASPRAVLSWARCEHVSIEEYAVLNAGIAELEPWSREWYTWMDGNGSGSPLPGHLSSR